jgi:hypothetical protein
MKVTYTGSIPICPFCKVGTDRMSYPASTTCMHFPPNYNAKGINTNPDRNIRTQMFQCRECLKSYLIRGNNVDGFEYSGI